MCSHEEYYKNNLVYSNFLEQQSYASFKKYADFVAKYCKNSGFFLDVGCGTGIILDLLSSTNIHAMGIDISATSIDICKKKFLDSKIYDGSTIPYSDKYFDVVGSHNVLEHVDNPQNFLFECLRVLKNSGHLIIVCPNFLALSNNYHWHTAGFINKIRNFIKIFIKLIFRTYHFEKMKCYMNHELKSDDDACNITNPIDIIKWAKKSKLKLIYWSCFSEYRLGKINYIDFGLIRLFLGSSFLIFKKSEIN